MKESWVQRPKSKLRALPALSALPHTHTTPGSGESMSQPFVKLPSKVRRDATRTVYIHYTSNITYWLLAEVLPGLLRDHQTPYESRDGQDQAGCAGLPDAERGRCRYWPDIQQC